jgi:uncharacterized protein GlcG (DUF336 family)
MIALQASAAQRGIAEIAAAAALRGLAVSIAVVDSSGYLVAALRMDGAGFLTPQIAEAKAFTAAAWKQPTAIVAERARSVPETFQAFIDIGRTKVVPGLGGQPISLRTTTIGAIGVSGASAEQDEELAILGVKAMLSAVAARHPQPDLDIPEHNNDQ